MIGCFPDPYPDELFYSICARYAERVRYPKKNTFFRDLFDDEQVLGALEVPPRLKFLVQSLPPEHPYTIDDFIDKHTLFPFFRPFLSPERILRLRQYHTGNGSRDTEHSYWDRLNSPGRTRYLRFCIECAREDRARFGEAYWHRIHQIQGILVCPTHAIQLTETKVASAKRAGILKYFSAEQGIPRDLPRVINHREVWFPILLDIAIDAAWLLEQRNLAPGNEVIVGCFHDLLHEQKLSAPYEKVRYERVIERFNLMYPDELLNQIQCQLVFTRQHWVWRVLKWKDSEHNPLHYLLLIHLLGLTASTFMELAPSGRIPFGSPPWPCLNEWCKYYHQRVIEHCQITYPSHLRRPNGTFACVCGFVYSRLGPDQSPSDQFKWTRVEARRQTMKELFRKI